MIDLDGVALLDQSRRSQPSFPRERSRPGILQAHSGLFSYSRPSSHIFGHSTRGFTMSSNHSEGPVVTATLPNELLLLVKEFIADSDLRTHVCFYNTCRTTAAFYGDSSQQAEFWRRACVLSGIGWLKADSSWKEIAFETIAKDGFCAHPHCGGALLESNGEYRCVLRRKRSC